MDALLEKVALTTISPDPANVRKHSRRNIQAIKASLQRFGQQKPIVVDANNVVRAGNGTLAAAAELGWKEITIIRTQLSGPDAVAYAIADNRTAELAQWDDQALATQVAELDEQLQAAAGFAQEELAKLLGEPAPEPSAGEEDMAVPELYQIVVTCRDETQQQELFQQLQTQGWECRVLTL